MGKKVKQDGFDALPPSTGVSVFLFVLTGIIIHIRAFYFIFGRRLFLYFSCTGQVILIIIIIISHHDDHPDEEGFPFAFGPSLVSDFWEFPLFIYLFFLAQSSQACSSRISAQYISPIDI